MMIISPLNENIYYLLSHYLTILLFWLVTGTLTNIDQCELILFNSLAIKSVVSCTSKVIIYYDKFQVQFKFLNLFDFRIQLIFKSQIFCFLFEWYAMMMT